MSEDKILKEIKKDLGEIKKKMIIASDLDLNKKDLKKYTNEVAKEILRAISDHDDSINSRLDEMELKFVTRSEFEALKRKVEQLQPAS